MRSFSCGLALLTFSAGHVAAQGSNQTASVTGTETTIPLSTASLTLDTSTATPSPTAPLDAKLPAQAKLAPTQSWCPSQIFCAGQIIQSVDLAQVFVDSKTFVDKPTLNTSNETIAAFNSLVQSSGGLGNLTEGDIVQFLTNNFQGEGLELEPLSLTNFTNTPDFLNNVSDPLVKAWTQTVHGFWTSLIRGTNSSTLCTGGKCESTLIPLNHTFVVPGGRFREQYYWDSYFIVEGLIKSQLFDIVNSTLQNFMDEIERFGFIPNGGRIYYLNRSQPPLFIHMLSNYVKASGDNAILKRGLQMAEAELKWWQTNRMISINSPFTNKTHTVAHYAVDINSAPRPESYLPDYQTVHGSGGDDTDPGLSDEEAAAMYAELASGAESGWDYSSRWMRNPNLGNATFTLPQLRTLNVRNTTPVDLNSILYNAHVLLADLYAGNNQQSSAQPHLSAASSLRLAILDLFWDSNKLAFYDFNRTSNARNSIWTTASFYPLWAGIVPPEVLSDKSGQKAFGLFASINMIMNKYNGTIPVTLVETGQQWDWPNTWPPHQYIILQALQALPSNITSGSLPQPSGNQTTFDLVPSGQLGPVTNASQLPVQTQDGSGAFGVGVDVNREDQGLTVVNGGNASTAADASAQGRGGKSTEGWAAILGRELSNRYITSAFCNWHATGGQIPGVLPRLSDDQLNVTLSLNNTGIMFEKFSVLNVDAAGVGGEYTVQAGFGWTNGVALWVAGEFGKVLDAPVCPRLTAADAAAATSSATSSSAAPSASQTQPGQKGSNGAVSVKVSSMVGLAGLLVGIMTTL